MSAAVTVDVAVVGAGLMGAATAWAAAQRGLSVVVLEQYAVGHPHGSSHGSARIVRRAYVDPFYVAMTGHAMELWRDLELASGTPLLRMLGGIDHGRSRDVPAISRALAQHDVAHVLLSPDEARARWRGMHFEGPVLFHPQAGTVDAAAAVTTFLRQARTTGAVVRDTQAVIGITVDDDAAVVLTDDGEVRARRVVVAAGSWTGDLLGGVVRLPRLTVTQQQYFHFPRHDDIPVWPVVVHKDALSTYSLPGGHDGGRTDARKVAEHDGGAVTTAADRDGRVDAAARVRMTDYVRTWLPGLVAEPFAEGTCLYTSTDNEDFVLDRQGPLVVLSPCSGHGAKFAPLIATIAVDLATGVREPDSRFSLAAHLGARA